MKFRITFLLIFSAINIIKGTTIYTCEDSLHSYQISIDNILSGDSTTFDCSVKSISIYNKKEDKLIQSIVPPENLFPSFLPKNQIILFDDVNFDGIQDFRIIQFTTAGPNTPYYYWLFDSKTQLFERDTTLEEITSPNFDAKNKLITSFWRDGCCDHGIDTYKYVNGKITLVEQGEIKDDADNPGKQILIRKKLVRGKMKMVKYKVVKSEN